MLAVGACLCILGIALILAPFGFSMTGLCIIAFGVLCGALWLLHRRGAAAKWRNGLLAFAAGGTILLETAMAAIMGIGMADLNTVQRADYAVVLGAQVRGMEPSPVLVSRLNCALRYLAENPDGKVVVSGAQGPDEGISEAEAMRNYLQKHGIAPSRILMEDQAHNTLENLRFSRIVMEADGGDATNFVLITSEYHMARAKFLATALECDVKGMSALTSQWIFEINYTLREVFAFVKAGINLCFGN